MDHDLLADTVRATPFGTSAPDAARTLAGRCLSCLAAGARDEARDALENAVFVLDSIPHAEIAAPAAVVVAEALAAFGDTHAARVRFEAALAVPEAVLGPHLARRARQGLARVLPPPPAWAGLRRAFGE